MIWWLKHPRADMQKPILTNYKNNCVAETELVSEIPPNSNILWVMIVA